MARRNPLSHQALTADVRHLYDTFNTGTDLAAVLVATSYLDECLRTLLLARMIESPDAEKLLVGPLGRYSARCDAALCLGLVGARTLSDLRIIGQVRNRFAHCHLDMTFGDADIVDLTGKLETWAADREAPVGYEDGLTPEGLRNNSRANFMICSAYISSELRCLARNAEHLESRSPCA